MQIGDMFEKPIDRKIKGVIKVGQKEGIYQELDEYVVTDELKKHFSEFFNIYSNGVGIPTDDIGVWISGFFGSGKSHFLKILSYILNSELTVENPKTGEIRRPIDFFKEDDKITDNPVIIADMIKSSNVSTDVILFNIDTKSTNSESEKDKILDVFVKVFNEMRGYCTEHPFLADFEEKLDEKGLYEEFKSTFKSISDEDWTDARDDFLINSEEVIQTIVEIGFMNENTAVNWAEKVESNYSMSIEKFAKKVEMYCSSKGKNHHVVFLVDEVGQYIGEDTKLMLNLQSITEELGVHCKGKAWIIVTSQQNIDDLVDVKGNDFSKIQGRFKTRLSLSSANVDEVIRKRLLAKNDTAYKTLKASYPQVEPILNNNFSFKDSAEMKRYADADDFASIYPFVPYQFNLLQAVLTSIREHGASGKHLAEGERSMLALFKHAAEEKKDEENDILIPFYIFYDALSNFIDHSHSSVIIKAEKNEHLTDFDVKVLKVLFLIKYVKELKANLDNITILMIEHIDEDIPDLRNKIVKSLVRLENETLIQKNGDIYSFLTNEEQDINREIKNEIVEEGEILNKAADVVFYDIFTDKKYRYNNKYNFAFNKSIDNIDSGVHKNEIGIRIITPYYDFNIHSTAQSTLSEYSEEERIYNSLKGLSESNNEVILYFSSDFAVFKEIEEMLQIEKHLKKNGTEIKPHLRNAKQEELQEKGSRVVRLLEKSLKQADIFVKGSKIDISEKNASERINDAFHDLIEKVFHKLKYMDFSPDKDEIMVAIKNYSQETFSGSESKANNALNDLDNYVKNQTDKFAKPSLKTIIGRFTSAPYGFIELDVVWVVAKLFSQKRISLLLNSEEISLKEYSADNIFKFLTGKEYKEKILIIKKKETPIKKIKITKQVLKDVFNEPTSSNNDEIVRDKFIEECNKKLAEINNCLTYYLSNTNYPGKIVLENARDLLLEVLSKKSIEQFYDFVFNHENDFLDMGEETYSVIQFFKNQKTYFDEANRTYKIFESNKNYINDEELINLANMIYNILMMDNPYSKIKDLPQLSDKFLQKHKQIIDEEKVTPQNDINMEFNEVSDVLNEEYEFKDELKNKFENKFKKDFDNLSLKLNKSNEISVIKGVSFEASNLKEKCLIEINKFKESKLAEKPGTTVVAPEPKTKSVDISVKFIASQSKVKIENEEDLLMFLNKIEQEVKKRLKENDVVNLKL